MTTTKTRPAPDGLSSKLAYLTRVLKTPTIGRTWQTLAEAARESNWSHEEYLAAVLERQVADPADQLRGYVGYWEACIIDASAPICLCALLAPEARS